MSPVEMSEELDVAPTAEERAAYKGVVGAWRRNVYVSRMSVRACMTADKGEGEGEEEEEEVVEGNVVKCMRELSHVCWRPTWWTRVRV